uniref:Uncharacterized protein n=1 Tax=Ciona intestinalis TaxID=7719 RepID=H2XJT8_CIOIN
MQKKGLDNLTSIAVFHCCVVHMEALLLSNKHF